MRQQASYALELYLARAFVKYRETDSVTEALAIVTRAETLCAYHESLGLSKDGL